MVFAFCCFSMLLWDLCTQCLTQYYCYFLFYLFLCFYFHSTTRNFLTGSCACWPRCCYIMQINFQWYSLKLERKLILSFVRIVFSSLRLSKLVGVPKANTYDNESAHEMCSEMSIDSQIINCPDFLFLRYLCECSDTFTQIGVNLLKISYCNKVKFST